MLAIMVDNVITITIRTRKLNIHNAQEILDKLKETAKLYNKNIIINLEQVESLDSTTIAMFVEFYNFLKDLNIELTFMNLSPFVGKIFEMLHISKFFNIK